MTAFGKLRKSIMGSLPAQVASLRRNETRAEQHLARISRTVLESFHATLEDSRPEALVAHLSTVDPELRGFACEGTGMGLTALDCVFPWKKRFLAFVAGPGSPYIYPAYVGAGLALARLGKQPEQYLPRLDPVVGWMVIDGGGFRGAVFSGPQYVEQQAIPVHLSSYARRIFDQGMGRGFWFLGGADAARISALITPFPAARQAEMWGGVGFACAYAGGAERAGIEILQAQAALYRAQLARGAAVGAKGRQRAGNMAPHTDLACEVLCGLSGDQAAHITDVALQGLPTNGIEPAYEAWRQRIEAKLSVVAESEIQDELQFAQHKGARS